MVRSSGSPEGWLYVRIYIEECSIIDKPLSKQFVSSLVSLLVVRTLCFKELLLQFGGGREVFWQWVFLGLDVFEDFELAFVCILIDSWLLSEPFASSQVFLSLEIDFCLPLSLFFC